LSGCSVSLSGNHRREQSSGGDAIGDLCLAIAEGRGEDALGILTRGDPSLQFIESSKDDSIDSLIRSGFAGLQASRDPSDALDALDDFKILCAHNQGIHGVDHWNERVKSLLGDLENSPIPLVIGVNDYSVGLFNGDDGVMLNNRCYFAGLDEPRLIPRSRLPVHRTGYASTIHKSQGSEFKNILIVLPSPDDQLLTRELLYVAVSRAQKGVILVGDPKSLLNAVAKKEAIHSGIFEMINEPDCKNI
jgi:exodeoxyribonuclease V alpha subunit